MARQIYPDVGECKALIVDANPTSRSILAAMLRDMGVRKVVQTGRVLEARRCLERGVFDIVLCECHFERSPMSGHELLDELRRAQLLPYSTVFVMVTGEASYAMVAEAAEAALDSYLLKPHTAVALEQRLLQARQRKKALQRIFEAIEAGDLATAAAECVARFEQRETYWVYAARIGAELNIRVGRLDAARQLYKSVHEITGASWARLGIARVEAELGKLRQACRTLAGLIAEQPDYADAYDVLGRVQLEQGNQAAALAACRCATALTPASVVRLQRQGTLAFLMGEAEEATRALERTVRLGLGSKMFDVQTLVVLALGYFDVRDGKAFHRNHASLETAVERSVPSARLQRFQRIGRLLRAMFGRHADECMAHTDWLAEDIRAADLDFEAATHLLGVLARLKNARLDLPGADAWVGELARRFCVSRATTDMMAMAVRSCEPYAAQVREGQAEISGMAEKALAHSVDGAPRAAVKALLAKGSETLNAKLIELASLLLQRHADTIGEAGALGSAIGELQRAHCNRATLALLGAGAGRVAGGLAIRS